jgi:hypothetical protein
MLARAPSSVRRSEQRCVVAEWPEVRQFVGVDDRVDACDLTADDLERQYAHRPLLPVEIERARAAVDVHPAQRYARNAGAEEGVDQRARDTIATTQRLRERRCLAAAVARQLHFVSEQRLESDEIAPFGGRKEAG